MDNPRFPKVVFNPLTFPDHTIPRGALPPVMEAQACWYFYTIAQKSKETVGDGPESQIILEGELWLDTHYVQQKRTIALMYGLESPSEMDKFWKFVRSEAAACGLPAPADSYVLAAPLVTVGSITMGDPDHG